MRKNRSMGKGGQFNAGFTKRFSTVGELYEKQ